MGALQSQFYGLLRQCAECVFDYISITAETIRGAVKH